MKYSIEVNGNEQQGRNGAALEPLEVRVRHDNGEPVFHLPVKFRLINGDGRFEHRDALTDIQGCAIAEFVPNMTGPYRVDCLIGGKGGQAVNFTGEIAPAAVAAAEATAAAEPAGVDETPTGEPAADPTKALIAEADEVLDSLNKERAGQDGAATTDRVPEPEAAAPVPEAEPLPTVIVDPDYLSEATAAAPVVQPALTDTAWMPDPFELPDVQTTEAAATATTAAADPQPAETVAATAPETAPVTTNVDDPADQMKWPVKMSVAGKIGIAVLSLVLALVLFVLVGHAVKTVGEVSPTEASGSVDCTGSPVKQVGQAYVFEDCNVKP